MWRNGKCTVSSNNKAFFPQHCAFGKVIVVNYTIFKQEKKNQIRND